MVQHKVFRKGFVFGIILLLTGTSILPNLSGMNRVNYYELHFSRYITTLLDIDFIYNITKALSNIIFTEYNESNGELAKGRFFGTKGEHKAAEILYENMTKIGLWTKKEQIQNIEDSNRPKLSELTHKIEILDYRLKINNESIVDFHIVPSKYGPKGDKDNLTCIFNYSGLKVHIKPRFLLPWRINNLFKLKDDFVFIEQDIAFNPDLQPPLKKTLSNFFNPLRFFLLFWSKKLIYDPEQERWYNFLDKCKGVIRFDFNNNTYNQGCGGASVPIIYINGTCGKKILDDLDNATVDFYLNQKKNESVISYNIIGQLNGTNPDKTVIVDCLYDSWWTQGTADAAIGMAMVLGIAKYFVDYNITPNCTLKFIGFCGEEMGLKGAQYYEAVCSEENITHVIDLNQICFWQQKHDPKLVLNVICNKLSFLCEIWKIVNKTDYAEITNYTADIRPLWMPLGAPSDDQVFAQNRPGCKTVCFLKDSGWLLHHRDGLDHNEGDVLKYFDWGDLNATGEIILNVTKYLACGDK